MHVIPRNEATRNLLCPWILPNSRSLGLLGTSAPPLFQRAFGSYFGCFTTRRYGFSVLNPSGYLAFAASSETEVGIITSSPGFQFTGVATLCFAVNCIESTTRKTSSKLRPVLIG